MMWRMQELEAMKLRLQQMEAESMAMKPDNSEVGISDDGVSAQGEGTVDPTVVAAATAAARAVVKEVNAGYGGVTSDQAVADADARSVYVGNVCTSHYLKCIESLILGNEI